MLTKIGPTTKLDPHKIGFRHKVDEKNTCKNLDAKNLGHREIKMLLNAYKT